MTHTLSQHLSRTQCTTAANSASALKGAVHSVETFGSVDGPGIRFVVFLKGCSMRCRYCHNPDTWHYDTSNLRTTDELLEQALRYRSYWREKGGITVSGGEALLQADFVRELFEKAKKVGVNTCLDTSAQPFTRRGPFFDTFNRLMEVTDLVLLDLKHIDPDRHKQLTGWSNEAILDCARYLSEINKPVWIRHVLVPTLTDQDEYLHQTAQFIRTLRNVQRIEVLPYHDLGVYKWEALGIPYTLRHIAPPTPECIAHAERILNGQS